MGNSASKKSGDAFQSFPSFSRSDTQGSSRSIKSIRSRMSISSEHSYKSALEDYDNGSNGSPNNNSSNNNNNNSLSSSNTKNDSNTNQSTNSNNNNSSNSNNQSSSTLSPPSHHNGIHHRRTSSGLPSPFNRNENAAEFPFPVPRSMQQLEPKEPILVKRNSEGLMASPADNNGSALSSSTGNLTGGSGFNSNSGGGAGGGGVNSAGRSSPMSIRANSLASAINGVSPATTPKSGNTPLPSPRISSSALNVPGAPNSGGFNVEEIIQRLLDAGYSGKTTKSVCLKNQEIALICQKAREIFMSQPMLLELSPPVKIVGDVHGQYGDLIRMFDMCGFPPAANYLFLGDYVDRGKQSLETILLLLCYKIKYPENFFLLRGNHECANVTRVYGFFDECKRRCNIKTWRIFVDTFNSLPIAAVVAQKIFCVHGGLSPSLNNLNEIRNLERPTDVPDYGLLNDLLWSDPADTPNEWEDNERGVSYCFNKVAINKFLAKFSFDLVCRAHMVVEDGYEFFNERSLVTVFSAPNYCGEFDNWGAVMSVSEELLCSFELLKPLDSVALKQEMRRGKQERRRIDERRISEGPQSY